MTRKLVLVFIRLAFAGILAASPSARATDENGSHRAESSTSDAVRSRSSGVACPSRPTEPKKCKTSSDAVDTDTFHLLRNRLRAGVKTSSELCDVDAKIVALQRCAALEENDRNYLVPALMRMLARDWASMGNFNRADELYQEGYAALESADDQVLAKVDLLEGWANLKVETGDKQRARELGQLIVAVARKKFATNRNEFSLSVIIDALKFQADIYEKVGSLDDAVAARQEAQELSKQQHSCRGEVCWEGEWNINRRQEP